MAVMEKTKKIQGITNFGLSIKQIMHRQSFPTFNISVITTENQHK